MYSNSSPQVTLEEFQHNLQKLHQVAYQSAAALTRLVRGPSFHLASLKKTIMIVDEHITNLTDYIGGTGSSLIEILRRLKKCIIEDVGNGMLILHRLILS